MSPATTLVRFAGSTPFAANEQVSVGRVRALDTPVWMVYRRDVSEWQRRRRCAVGAVVDLDVLDVLMDLPADLPVPLRSLGSAQRRMLGRLPAGAVRQSDGAVVRRLVPAVTPLLAIVPGRAWQPAVEAASRFAVYCPRMVSFPGWPEDTEAAAALSQASLYGIGVAVGGPKRSEILVEPEPLTDWQPTPAWWAFGEKIYAQVCGKSDRSNGNGP